MSRKSLRVLGACLSIIILAFASIPTASTSASGDKPGFPPVPPWPYGMDNDIMPPPESAPSGPGMTALDYKVVPVLFVPNDLKPNPLMLRAIDREMRFIQRWYAEQLRDRTFVVEPAQLVIGQQPLAYYYGSCYPPRAPCVFTVGYQMWGNIFNELSGRGFPWQHNRVIGVFFQEDGVGGTALGGGNRFLVGVSAAGAFSDCLQPGCATRVLEGAVAHELGHAFGLPHPELESDIWERSVMGIGYLHFPRVTLVNTPQNPERDRLYTSPFFNPLVGLKNPGFEQCLDYWNVSAGTAGCSDTTRLSGMSALQLTSGSTTSLLASQDVPVQEYQTYNVSGWVNIPAQASGSRFQAQVLARSAAGAVLSTFNVATYTTTTSGWERIAASFTMPAGATAARVQLSRQGTGATVYVDDLDLHLAQQAPQNPLPMFYMDGDAVPTLQPLLRWSDVTDATAFQVQVAADPTFQSPLVDAVTPAPFYTVRNGLAYDARYFWRVKASNGFGQSEWSPVWSFIPRASNEYYNDEFESSTLSSAWSWTRGQPYSWALSGPAIRRQSGYMGIATRPGDLLGNMNNAQNILLRSTPSGDFEASTTVDWWGPLGANYQQGGLLIYQDDDNYIKLVHAHNDGFKIELLAEVNGQVVMNASTPIVESRPIKLVRVGNSYSGYYSPDGFTWRRLGDPVSVSWSQPRMGLTAFRGNGPQEVWAYFDWFRVGTPLKATSVGKATGGGTVASTSSGAKANFGFTVERASASSSVSGSLQYQDHGAKIKVHSSAVKAATFNGKTATFSGSATVNGKPNVSFTVTVQDQGEPGRKGDTFSIRLGSGYANSGTLTGGNIQLHQR